MTTAEVVDRENEAYLRRHPSNRVQSINQTIL